MNNLARVVWKKIQIRYIWIQTDVHLDPNQSEMVNTIWFQVDLIRFRKHFWNVVKICREACRENTIKKYPWKYHYFHHWKYHKKISFKIMHKKKCDKKLHPPRSLPVHHCGGTPRWQPPSCGRWGGRGGAGPPGGAGLRRGARPLLLWGEKEVLNTAGNFVNIYIFR